MYDIAVGDLGLSRDQFERMEFGEFICRVQGRHRSRLRELEDLRLIVWASLAPHSKKKLKPTDVFKLDGDGRKDVKPMAKERLKELDKIWQPKN